MSNLSDSIQRSRYMDAHGHNKMIIETRDLKADRSKPTVKKRVNKESIEDFTRNLELVYGAIDS